MAVGHLGLGRPNDALRYGRRAVHDLRRARHAYSEPAVALDTLSSWHQELGRWVDAGQLRAEAVTLLATESLDSAELCLALVRMPDVSGRRAQYDNVEELLQRARPSTCDACRLKQSELR